jgi:hypothetical protein
MQIELELNVFVEDLDEKRARRWKHGASAALEAVRNISAQTWELAAALSEMLWAGGDKRLHAFWKQFLRGVLTLKVAKRLVRLWHAFKNHPDRDMLGPDVWAFVNADLTESELSDVEGMAKAGATPEELRARLEQIGRAAEDRRAAQPYNEDAVKARVREWLEAQGVRVDGEVAMANGRVCDLVTDSLLIECKAALTLQNWDKAIGQVDSYQWCQPQKSRALAFQAAAVELQLLMRQAADNGYKLLRVDPATKDCEWLC